MDLGACWRPDAPVLAETFTQEEFAAITGERARLASDMLVIADAEKAVALAGVLYGQVSLPVLFTYTVRGATRTQSTRRASARAPEALLTTRRIS